MSYRNEARLNKLIRLALEDAAIKKGITETDNISNEFLMRLITDNQEQVWKEATQFTFEYDKIEKEIQDIETTHKDVLSLSEVDATKKITGNIESIGSFIFIGCIVLGIVLVNMSTDEDRFAGFKNVYVWLGIVGLIALVAGLFILNRRRKKVKQNLLTSRTKIINETKVDILKGELASLGERADNVVVNPIKELMILEINRNKAPSFSIYLDNINAPGLSQVINSSKTISTKAKTNLDFLFNNMSGGSIGIAGPRGAGKSTLIQNYCGSDRTVDKIKDKPVLPVFTSAPVQYEPRDFILHLFATTCYSVISVLEKTSVRYSANDEIRDTSNPKREIFPAIKKIARAGLTAGAILLALGIVIFICSLPRAFKQLPDVNIFNLLEIKYAPVTRWGLLLIGISYFLYSAIDVPLKETMPFSYFLRLLNKNKPGERKVAEEQTANEEDTRKAKYVKMAKDNLKQIKFQQTYTSGWSGALKTPLGLEGGISSATTIAEKQMTNPEIVYEFIQFIKAVSSDYQIIIGIDELDKIATDDLAQKFLNEIKSIFGLSNCFYLISVSENAMSSFERRGLPFRDVFDSSFDCLVHVDYFDLKESISLLERRVIGKPMQYFYLSYCLSGGLPRDLIRAFRQIVEIRRKQNDKNDLASITDLLIRTEVSSKVRATNYLLKKQENLNETDELFSYLYELQNKIEQAGEHTLNTLLPDFLANISKWQRLTSEAKTKAKNDAELSKCYDSILQYAEELYMYLSLMLTLSEFFDNSLDESKVTKIGQSEYRKLAHAKQFMAIDSVVTKGIIKDFRQTHGMTPLLKEVV